MSVNKVNSDGSLLRVAGGTLYADAPIGTISPFGGSTVPNGYLLCDGAEVLKTTYAELYAVIGDAFGTASVNTKFVLPDLRESVPKGAGLTGKTVGAHLDADGLAVGEFLDDRIQDHTHELSMTPNYSYLTGEGNYKVVPVSGGTTQTSVVSSTYRNGVTTEVKSVGVNYIIKAKQVALPSDFIDALAKYNELSDFELMSASGTIQYDGFIYAVTSVNKAAFRVELTRNETTLRLDGSYAGGGYGTSNCIPVRKGDIYTSTDADIYGSFYKNR